MAITLTAERRNALLAHGIRRADGIMPTADRKDALCVGAALVLEVSVIPYLIVSPEATQWVTEWEAENYDVKSNRDWKTY